MSDKPLNYMIATPSRSEYGTNCYDFELCGDIEDLKENILRNHLDKRARFFKLQEIKVSIDVITSD